MFNRKRIAERLKRVTTVRQAHAIAEEIERDSRIRVTDAKREQVLELHHDGYSVGEIAGAVELSPPTVRKIISEWKAAHRVKRKSK